MRDIAKLSLRLMAFALVSALMLAVVNALTKERIADNERAKVDASRIAVLGAYDFEEINSDLTGYSYIKHVYVGKDGGTVKGYVYELESAGFGGVVALSVGIDAAGTITGVDVASHTETKGLGTDQEGPFLSQFVGLSAANAGTGNPEAPATTSEASTGASATSTPEAATGASATSTPGAAASADATTGATWTQAPAAATEAATGASATASADATTGATWTESPAATTDATTGATTDGTTGATTETELSGAAASGAVAEVDGMTGATYSTNAVKNAVAEALTHFAANYLGGGAPQ